MAAKIFRTSDGSETWTASGDYCTSCTIKYLVFDCLKHDAIKLVSEDAPSYYEGLRLKEIRFTGFTGEGALELEAVYEKNSENSDASATDSEVDEPATLSFDCTSTQKTVLHAISQVQLYGSSESAGLLVGWNGKHGSDMEVRGADVPSGVISERLTKRIRSSRITTAYKRKLRSMVGVVNSTAFNGWNPGEVMFLGASFSGAINEKKVTVTYNFGVQENEVDCIYDGQHLGFKEGYQYVWSISESEVTSGGNAEPKTKAIFLATICKYGNLNELGI